MSKKNYRIGQIVPSSNTTMETEVPAMLRAREAICPERFTFHSSRMRMLKVVKSELEAMDKESDRCAQELSDAAVDVIGYACLVAIMSMGKGYHRESERRLGDLARANSPVTQVITSAGALLNGISALNAKRVAIVTPYMKPLTQLVVDYICHEGVEVVDALSLEISDNRMVGNRDPLELVEVVKNLKIEGADAIVLSACVQMPSLAAIPIVEEKYRLPVISAASCTVYTMLQTLELARKVPGAGRLLSGNH